MLTKRARRQYNSEIVNIEEMIPSNHYLRIIDYYFDWDFIYEEVEKKYSSVGRPSIDPVVLFKVHIIKFLFHEDSIRKTYESLKYNLLYKWFIGYGINEEVPDHSTYSQNYKRKYKDLEKDILQTVFDKVIELLIKYHCIDATSVYIDSTNTKAYANKKKNHKEIVKIEAKKYQKELELEMLLHEYHNDEIDEEEYMEKAEKIIKCNEETETRELLGEKEVIVSDTDKDAGMLYKSEKEKMFGYNSTVICDNNNYALVVDVNPSNMHDSIAFYGAYDKLKETIMKELKINYMAGDAAYITPHICKTIYQDGIIPCLPYKRPMTKKGYFKKYDYIYDEAMDIYICPNNCDLTPRGMTKDGYINYKSNERDCMNCPLKGQCTKSKQKTITRHIWEQYKEIANEYRHHNDVREVYTQRSSHIERLYADGKTKHGLEKTYYRGKEKVARELTLLYTCMNLKKFALMKQKYAWEC